MQAAPGLELTCRAKNATFRLGRAKLERGIISYYAARALPTAVTGADWLDATHALADADVRSGALPALDRPTLQLPGATHALLPGAAVAPKTTPRLV